MMEPEPVQFQSLGDEISGALFIPASNGRFPVLIVCHGAGEFKENYFELCETLMARGVASLALDMHGHGASGGERFCVRMNDWVPDICAAIDYLTAHPGIDEHRIAAFGLSSGGTAILEAAIVDRRLKALVALDATVRNSLPFALAAFLRSLVWLGQAKKNLTGWDLRVPLAKLSKANLASDPHIQKKLLSDPRGLEAFMHFPFPSSSEAFFVDTLKRVPQIEAPTLVLWGEDDRLDPPETGRLLHAALTCEKELHIIPGNGHVGHLDRNRERVFELTAGWVLERTQASAPEKNGTAKYPKIIEGLAAKALGRKEKWEKLSPFLKQYGREALSYPTLQAGMEYFIDECGYIAYVTVQHPVLARKPKPITFSDPVCAPEDYSKLIGRFLAERPGATFACISEACAEVLRAMKFKVNCIGHEVELAIPTYNTNGNWKELDLIKRARNEVRREGITIREEVIENVHREQLHAVSNKWISTKKLHDREIWIYARRPIFESEADVRKFVAYDREGRVAGFAFYDPMYRDGKIFGYAANILRTDEQRFGRLTTAIHMEAVDQFKAEGKEVLNLCLSPFVKLEGGKYNDDWGMRKFFEWGAKYGNSIYNFNGLAFHKTKYRGTNRFLYVAATSLWPSNDVYLAFLCAGVTRSYFDMLSRLLWGVATSWKNKNHKTSQSHS